MAKQEILTDIQVYRLLEDAEIKYTPQGSDVEEIDNALKTASKKQNNNAGFPEFVAVVKDFVLVGEDKPSTDKHCQKNNGVVSQEQKSVENYAVNGALWYAKQIVKKTNFKKVFAFGCSGNDKSLRITPLFVNERGEYEELSDVETFYNFTNDNIQDYYTREILKEDTDYELETKKILQYAGTLHEDLRNYGNLQNKEKPIVVSGILLALNEKKYGAFSIDQLTADTTKTDGTKIFDAISSSLIRSRVSPDVKKDKILDQFRIIKNSEKLNEYNDKLGKTPLKYYTEFLDKYIFKPITNLQTTEDYLGRFYGEFMSYGDNDGQSLGIVLTPKHITELFCDLIELKKTDSIFDPCCGTAGFLITAMTRMFNQTIKEKGLKPNEIQSDPDIQNIREHQLHGIELQEYMFSIATTNMILRGDGKSNIECKDFLLQNSSQLQLKGCNIGMMNPPYSMGSKTNSDLYEISFINHLLNSISSSGKAVVIVPQSTMTGKTKEEKEIKRKILKNHTLEGVITLNKDTFYGVGVYPVIAVFTTGQPHPKDKKVKFINFEDDGYEVSQHIGLLPTDKAIDKKQHLLNAWFATEEEWSSFDSKFLITTTVTYEDEWLHSFYYFNDEIPSKTDFESVVNNYLSFQFKMVISNFSWLFNSNNGEGHLKFNNVKQQKITSLSDKKWLTFQIGGDSGLFKVNKASGKKQKELSFGETPYISATEENNGLAQFCNEEKFHKAGEITVSDFGIAFVQPADFQGTHTTVLTPNFKASFYSKLFICTSIIKASKGQYNFSHPVGKERFKKQRILLPVNENDEPDYEYMEQYISNVINEKFKTYINFTKENFAKDENK